MGGNALLLPSVRLTKKNFERLTEDCLTRLRTRFPDGRFELIESYRCKADFGDADIVCWTPEYDPQELAAALGAVEVVRNGPVTSVGVVVRSEVPAGAGNIFQVDLIRQAQDEFDFALRYFKANDAGNLAGRLAKAMGATLRHDGLFYYVREGDYKFREILLTRDYGKALSYIGLDPVRFEAGFDTLTDIFEFIVSSPFFRVDIYLLENRNATSRVRDRKRPTYKAFLEYCMAHPELPSARAPEDKSVWLKRLGEFFPEFLIELEKALADMAQGQEAKKRYNGALVSELTGLQGKELGALMRAIRDSFVSDEEQRTFVLESDPIDIEVRVLQVHQAMTS